MFEQALQMLKYAGVKDNQLGLVIGLGLFVILVPLLLAVKSVLAKPSAPPPVDPAHQFDMGVAPPENVTPADGKPLPPAPPAKNLPVVQESETVMMPRLKQKKEKKIITSTTSNVTRFEMKSDAFYRVHEMSRGGASLGDMCRAVNGEYEGWDDPKKRDFEEMVQYMLKMKAPGKDAAVSASFTSSPGQKDISFVSVQNGPVHTHKIDHDMLARARTMLVDGASVEEICQAVIHDYEGLSDPVRFAFQEALLKLLDIEGKSG